MPNSSTPSPESMTAALIRIVDRAERARLDKAEADFLAKVSGRPNFSSNLEHETLKNTISAEAARSRESIPRWVSALHRARLKVSTPKVLRVRGQYAGNMCVLEDGLFVAAQVVIHFDSPGETRVRVFDMKELAGWRHFRSSVRIPLLGMTFFLGAEEEKLLEQDFVLCSCIARLVDPLVAEAETAVAVAKARASELVRAFRAPILKDEESVLAERLQPFLKDNPLSGLPPAALVLIFKTPWKELERIVSFLKGNSAMAGGVTEESVDHILKLIVAREVMSS